MIDLPRPATDRSRASFIVAAAQDKLQRKQLPLP